jgi:hypothetical protein
LFTFVFCPPTDVLDDVPRIASPEGLMQIKKDFRERDHNGGVTFHARPRANPARDLVKLFVSYVRYLDFGLDSAHEGFVGQAGRIQVGREGNNQIKGDIEFVPPR